MPINSDKLICSWCLEEKVSSVISFCTNCGDSSYVCHSCLREGKSKVFNQQLITDCSICKENKLINLPNNQVVFAFGIQKLFSVNSAFRGDERRVSGDSNDPEVPSEERLSGSRTGEIDCQLIKKKIYRAFIWFLIFLIISWMFAPFTYFIIFRMRNSKNYFGKFYITWSTGMVCGFPLTILFREYIRRRCLPSQ